ncbi:tyrosine-type recombinase/integrase [Sporosarcina sp. ANT_H38]|uniref:tyrosine-type recombinase/integrase n=1 Tax=Sporosarcina sp. ANT_H38 TaxID=2597358 RepID=UPI00165D7804
MVFRIGLRPITSHCLRHTHASIMISKGIPLNTIADLLGNTPEMILRVCSNSFNEFDIDSVKASTTK